MNEEGFKRILYLIFKNLIKKTGYLSQLEIFKYVHANLQKSFKFKDTEHHSKINQGKNDEFKDIYNFILNILVELQFVTDKMENKSYYFKWNSIKGFYNKYYMFFKEDNTEFTINESIEHKCQIYTRKLLIYLFKNPLGITQEKVNFLINECGLEIQNTYREKIHSILCFIGFIIKIASDKEENSPLFTLTKTSDNKMDNINEIIFKLNFQFFDEKFQANNKLSEIDLIKFNEDFNKMILDKGIELGEITNPTDADFDLNSVEYTYPVEQIKKKDKCHGMIMNNIYASSGKKAYEKHKEGLSGNGNDILTNGNSLKILQSPFKNDKTEDSNKMISIDNNINTLNKYRVSLESLKSKSNNIGFFKLKGENWEVYMKQLHCFIGRKTTRQNNEKNWEVDVDLGPNQKISRQHALIAYNFLKDSFEIKNISKKKFPIKVNGKIVEGDEEVLLSDKSKITIGGKEFSFLLPK